MSNITVDVSFDKSIESWERLGLLTPECHNVNVNQKKSHSRKWE